MAFWALTMKVRRGTPQLRLGALVVMMVLMFAYIYRYIYIDIERERERERERPGDIVSALYSASEDHVLRLDSTKCDSIVKRTFSNSSLVLEDTDTKSLITVERLFAQFSSPRSNITNLKYYMHVLSHGDVVSTNFLTRGGYEEGDLRNMIFIIESLRMERKISRADVQILDIGANIGTYGILLSKLGYDVTMFEPFWINQQALIHSICMNDIRASLVPIALSNDSSLCLLRSPYGNILDGVLDCDTKGQPSKDHQVQTGRLDDIQRLLRNSCTLIVMKIDVEGSELRVLEGSRTLFSQCPPLLIQVEFNPDQLKLHGTNPEHLLDFLLRQGYHGNKKGFGNPPENATTILSDRRGNYNVYFSYSGVDSG